MRAALLILVLGSIGYGHGHDGQLQQPVDAALDGTWIHHWRMFGSSETLRLHQEGQAITGCGTYLMEAGRCGQSQIEGTFVNGKLTLKLERDYGQRATYSAVLSDPNSLSGTFTFEGFNADENVVFVRIDETATCPL
jgi:hypothetical protein